MDWGTVVNWLVEGGGIKTVLGWLGIGTGGLFGAILGLPYVGGIIAGVVDIFRGDPRAEDFAKRFPTAHAWGEKYGELISRWVRRIPVVGWVYEKVLEDRLFGANIAVGLGLYKGAQKDDDEPISPLGSSEDYVG